MFECRYPVHEEHFVEPLTLVYDSVNDIFVSLKSIAAIATLDV